MFSPPCKIALHLHWAVCSCLSADLYWETGTSGLGFQTRVSSYDYALIFNNEKLRSISKMLFS